MWTVTGIATESRNIDRLKMGECVHTRKEDQEKQRKIEPEEKDSKRW